MRWSSFARMTLALVASGCSHAPECTEVWADRDGDGHGDPLVSVTACDAPAGFSSTGDDCDDARADVHPGAVELCNAVDDDCDGGIDLGGVDPSTWYADADGDAFGDDHDSTIACVPPIGWVEAGGDCADDDPDVNPGADELCNESDDDCDGLVDSLDPTLVQGKVWHADADGDGFGDPATAAHACEEPADRISDGTDCDDGDGAIHPGVDEVCDHVDNDCDGLVDADDDGVLGILPFYTDADGDGSGVGMPTYDCWAPSGYAAVDGDCDDADASVGAYTEYYEDTDGDGYGFGPLLTTCTPTPGLVLVDGDCRPANGDAYPGAPEVCDHTDNNCDGLVDDDDPLVVATAYYADSDGDGYGDPATMLSSCSALSGYVESGTDCDDADAGTHPDALEYCDGADNDCDGTTDGAVVYVDWYADHDGDGYGDAGDVVNDCIAPSGYLSSAGDCDDGASTVHPGATELCANGGDDDCDGHADNCVLAPTDADFVVIGASGSVLGYDLAGADVDGDGTADLVTAGWSGAGGVYVAYGPTSGSADVSTLTALVSTSSTASFGYSIDGGDADDDGQDDLLVGAVGSRTAYLFLGPVTASRQDVDSDAMLVGTSAWTGANSRVVHDVDGDASSDLVVGAPLADSDHGAVYVASGLVTGSFDLATDATYVLTGPVAGDQLGWTSGDAGDMNGDGVTDLAATARYHSNGVVYVVDGGLAAGSYAVDSAASSQIEGPEVDAEFGIALAGTDYDGDGTTDLVVGAEAVDSSASTDAGAVYAFLGPLSGVLDTADASTQWVPGSSKATGLGFDVAAGDIDGDDQSDLLLGAYTTAPVANPNGAAFVQFGFVSGIVEVDTLLEIAGGEAELFGAAVALLEDWTGDGGNEVAIAAPFHWTGSGNVGASYVFGSDALYYR